MTPCNLQDCPKTLGNWTDLDVCKAEGTDSTCGPGKRNQTRICTDGTADRCTESDTNQIVSCALRDCPKILGRWRDAAGCDTYTQEKSCGPGSMFQTRECSDGTTDRCTKWDKQQYTGCSLADCPKKLGNWTTSGNCVGTGSYSVCGEGLVSQTRTCVDGTSDKCSTSDKERKVNCTLPSCYTGVGDWTNVGACNAIGNKKTCGPGRQQQTRACTDGVVYKCTPAITQKTISCSLPDCPKELGDWVNDGGCIASGTDKSCGPGNQKQTRNRVDGTRDKCTASDVTNTLSCSLPDCPKKLGIWVLEACIAIGSDKSCGPGRQRKTRSCEDGTNDKCHPRDREETTSCNLKDCPKVLGTWYNVGSCVAIGTDPYCGPGNQRQTRSCVDGTRDRCSNSDRYRYVTCNKPDCPKKFGPWRNNGQCQTSHGKQCGNGKQSQIRDCTDGTRDKCQSSERQREITCKMRACTGS